MTLIATFERQGIQFLIGDSLISSTPEFPISIPSALHEGSGFLTEAAQISDLCQKVVHVGSQCVLGWAGMKIAAEMVIQELQDLQNSDNLTYDNIRTCFASHRESGDARHISIVGWLREEGVTTAISLNALQETSPDFGQISVAGSGMMEFLNLVRHHERIFATPGGIDPELGVRLSGPLAQDPMFTVLALTGDLLHVEAKNMTTVADGFGGSYQIAYFDGSQFRQIDEVTYFNVKIVYSKEGFQHQPYLLTKYQRHDELVCLDYCSFPHGQDIPSMRQIIPPVGRNRRTYTECELQPILKKEHNLNSKWLVAMTEVRFENDNQWKYFGNSTYCAEAASHPIKFYDGDGFRYTIAQDFAASLYRDMSI